MSSHPRFIINDPTELSMEEQLFLMGLALEQRRVLCQFTLEEVAANVGTGPAYMRRIETGTAQKVLHTMIIRICAKLAWSMGDLYAHMTEFDLNSEQIKAVQEQRAAYAGGALNPRNRPKKR